ncbi:CBO0543 family protein [Metabacillus herbersteinensis]|uniref:CBO0543 family protein n=1 Tax=Metabacillus herbersteinensis TaxID=283816 RepID=A0ABV6GK68_9BACI
MKSSIPTEQSNRLEELKDTQEKLSTQWIDYWNDYSSIDTWQFWVNVGLIIIPLIILYFLIDRKKIFILGFFGLNIHVWSAYLDAIATRHNYLEYPYKAIPFIPINFGVDTALVPVSFILLYQWTLSKNKNFYLYSLVLIGFISFIFRPLTAAHHLLHLNKGANYFHIFIGYIIITLFSKGITNVFQYLHTKNK